MEAVAFEIRRRRKDRPTRAARGLAVAARPQGSHQPFIPHLYLPAGPRRRGGHLKSRLGVRGRLGIRFWIFETRSSRSPPPEAECSRTPAQNASVRDTS